MVGIIDNVARPHALMLPFPAQGHVRPLMQLAQHLNRVRGFKITFANTSNNHKRLGLQNASREEDGFRFLDLQDGFPDDYYTVVNIVKLVMGLNTLGPILKTLVEKLLLDSPITCIISDLDFFQAQETANDFGIPHVGFGTHLAVGLAPEVHYSKLVEERLLPLPPLSTGMAAEEGIRTAAWPVSAEDAVALARPVTCVPEMYPMTVGELFSALLVRDITSPIFQLFDLQIQHFRQNAWTLINTFHELEAPVIESLQREGKVNLTAIGPLLIKPTFSDGALIEEDKESSMTSFWPEDTKCMDWLDKQEQTSVVYVSFGSYTHMTTNTFNEFILGLENSQVPFLLVLRKDFVKDPTTNNFQSLPPGFEERTKDRALVVPWAPQLKVLAHSATAGFVSHCGWNSVLESMSMGVPTLGYPYFADQNTINRYVVSVWKTGLEFEATANMFVERQEVVKKVKALAAKDSTVRAAALKWKDVARRSVEKGGSSHNNMAAFVADMYRRAQVAAFPSFS